VKHPQCTDQPPEPGITWAKMSLVSIEKSSLTHAGLLYLGVLHLHIMGVFIQLTQPTLLNVAFSEDLGIILLFILSDAELLTKLAKFSMYYT
jgi:hypothetical protein